MASSCLDLVSRDQGPKNEKIKELDVPEARREKQRVKGLDVPEVRREK